jgi:hypothetical protein
MKIVVLFAMLVVPSIASAEAILLRTSWETWPTTVATVQMRGTALLDPSDPTSVTGGWLYFHNSSYQMQIREGTWDPDKQLINLEGAGCTTVPHPDLCAGPDVEMTYVSDDLGTRFLVEGQPFGEAAYGVHNRQHLLGDSNVDGVFGSDDMVMVFQLAEYEDNRICVVNEFGNKTCEINEVGLHNSNWHSGDWNADREFDSSDLVAAFVEGQYERGERGLAPEPSAIALVFLGAVVLVVLAVRGE